ncbi:hypothetical protein [Euzebya sp.]|uniref:hypothetical protein n=1 Tax=Euzebya sp. TaxID=1971409 RepID=UPI0035153369
MSANTRPNQHAVIAHVADEPTAEAVLSSLADEASVDLASVSHGSGDEFAGQLEAGEEDSHGATRVVKWLVSLGQEREELVRLGQVVREGRHGIVINDVTDRETLDRIVAVLNRHDARDIVYFGDWQTEDLSIRR